MRVGVGLAGIAGIACFGSGSRVRKARLRSRQSKHRAPSRPNRAARTGRSSYSTANAPLIVGTAELGGLEIYDHGQAHRLGRLAKQSGSTSAMARLPGLGSPPIVAGGGRNRRTACASIVRKAAASAEVSARPVPLGIAVEGRLPLSKHARTARFMRSPWATAARSTSICCSNRQPAASMPSSMRRLHVASTVEHCVADDRDWPALCVGTGGRHLALQCRAGNRDCCRR